MKRFKQQYSSRVDQATFATGVDKDQNATTEIASRVDFEHGEEAGSTTILAGIKRQ